MSSLLLLYLRECMPIHLSDYLFHAGQSHDFLCFNTLRPRQRGRHFANDIFKCISLNENVWLSIKILMKFVPEVRITKISVLVQIMAWRQRGDKPLSGPMMVSLLTHICVTLPQWIKHLRWPTNRGFLLRIQTCSLYFSIPRGFGQQRFQQVNWRPQAYMEMNLSRHSRPYYKQNHIYNEWIVLSWRQGIRLWLTLYICTINIPEYRLLGTKY